jgi:uncharacterized protein (TIGR02246 family)
MRRPFFAALLLLASASLLWAQAGKNPGVDRLRAAYEKAAAAGNVQDLVALYAADAIVMPPDAPMVKGKTNIEAFHRKNFETAALSNVKITPLNTEVSGDTTIEVGTYTQTVTPKGGQAMAEAGKYVVVLKKQADDSWKLAYEIFNSDKPMTMPPATVKK